MRTGQVIGRIADKDRPDHLHIWLLDTLHTCRCPDQDLWHRASPGQFVHCLRTKTGNLEPQALIDPPPGTTCPDVQRWRRPSGNTTRMALLRLRQQLVRVSEAWFDERNFLQVFPPLLLPAVNPESQLRLIRAGSGYLSTSPELQLKRMLCGGFDNVWSLTPCFRAGEEDATHNPEFTMLEWYRRGADLQAMAHDLEEMLLACKGRFPALDRQGILNKGGQRINLEQRPWPRITVGDLFLEYLGLDIKGCTEQQDLLDRGRCKALFAADNAADSYEQLFSRLWSRLPRLGTTRPLFITEWPAPLASLAALKVDDPAVALRMELVLGDLELANGFQELTDPGEQRRRFAAHLQYRQQAGLPDVAQDERFLHAMDAGLPPCAGMALGFDRLCLLLCGAGHIREVLAFSSEEC